MTAIDYTNYSMEELGEALNNINKEKYPENYENLVEEIRKRSLIKVAVNKESESLYNNFARSEPEQVGSSGIADGPSNQSVMNEPTVKRQADEDVYSSVSPGIKKSFLLVAVILLVNAANTIIQGLASQQYIATVNITSIIFDLGLAVLLLTFPGRTVANIIIFRISLGTLQHSLAHIKEGHILIVLLQLVYAVSIILLLTIEFKPKIRNTIASIVLVLLLGLAGNSAHHIYLRNNLDKVYALESEEIKEFSGKYFDYKITLNTDDWHLRSREAAVKELPIIDQWAVKPSRDAHLMVIGEQLEYGQSVEMPQFKEGVINNLRINASKLKVVKEFSTTNEDHDGRIVHVRANVNLRDMEYFFGLYILGDKLFQVITVCKEADFRVMHNTFIRAINSFKFEGEIRKPVSSYEI